MVLQQLDLITDLQNFVFLVNKRFMVAQHGLGNPIMIKDDEEGKEDDEGDVFFPLPGIPVVIHDVGVLQEIKEDGPLDHEE